MKIWRGKEVEEQVIANYPETLPKLLQRYGLDSSVSRIELEEEKLENVVLRKINQDQDKLAEEGDDDGDD